MPTRDAADLWIDLAVFGFEPDNEYHAKADRFLSSHPLADFRKSPLLYHRRRLGLAPREDRPAWLLGRAGHVRILEGRDKFDRIFAIGGPVNPTTGKPYGATTKAFAEWAAAQGRPVLTCEQAQLVENLAVGVSMNDAAVDLICDGVAEGVVRAEYCGEPCQIRIDWLNPRRGIVDLKTCDDIDYFMADGRRYGYAYQMAFYRSVLAVASGQVAPVHFIAVEKKEPYRAGVFPVLAELLDGCAAVNAACIAQIKECRRTGIWPTGYEIPRVFDAA